jgi:hypothetical protein
VLGAPSPATGRYREEVGGIGDLFVAIITTAIFAIPISLSLWALLDCAKRPGWAWALSGRSQQVWMATILCGILLVPVGMVISAYYLLRIRPSVADAEQGKVVDPHA